MCRTQYWSCRQDLLALKYDAEMVVPSRQPSRCYFRCIGIAWVLVLGTCTIALLLGCFPKHVEPVESLCRARHHHYTICAFPPYIRISGAALLADLTTNQVFFYLQHDSSQLPFKLITEYASSRLSLYTMLLASLWFYMRAHTLYALSFSWIMDAFYVGPNVDRTILNVFKHVRSSVQKIAAQNSTSGTVVQLQGLCM